MFPSILQKTAHFAPKTIASRMMIKSLPLSTNAATASDIIVGVSPKERPFHHFRKPHTNHKKYESPRKRANKMMTKITEEAKQARHNPKVHDVKFRVGDSIELAMVAQGGVNSNETEKIRGVVLGMDKGGLGTGIYLRDVVFGEPIDRKIPLYSPLIKSITVLEENFVFKKKRKVKRAKLYYLRDRLPQETRVTKY